jgi:hypothetical protein
MLAPFFLNLLVFCVLMLFVGWVLDVVSGWMHHTRHDARVTPRLSAGHTQPIDPLFVRSRKVNTWGC